jgi:hypothetical protein
MSGVLERMAKRAMGTSAAVQPVTAPRYAPPAVGPRKTGLGLELTAEVEAEASHGGREVIPRGGPHRTGELERPGKVHGESSAANRAEQAGEQGRQAVRALSRGDWRKSAPVEGESEARPERKDDFTSRNEMGRERGAIEPAQQGEFEPADGGRLRLRGVDAAEDRIEAEARNSTASETAGSVVLRYEPERREAAATVAIRKGNQKVAEMRSAERRGEPTRVRQGATAPEKTEVHISIGRIEMRAPRVEPGPQPAPFRPRVTLDEFLRRHPENRP